MHMEAFEYPLCFSESRLRLYLRSRLLPVGLRKISPQPSNRLQNVRLHPRADRIADTLQISPVFLFRKKDSLPADVLRPIISADHHRNFFRKMIFGKDIQIAWEIFQMPQDPIVGAVRSYFQIFVFHLHDICKHAVLTKLADQRQKGFFLSCHPV